MPMTRPLIAASLHKAILLSMLLVGLISIGCVGFFWISGERARFRAEAASLRSNHLASQKKMIRNEVDRVIEYIDYQRTTTERKLKADIRSRVDEAIAVADHIHQHFGDRRTEAEIAEMIKEVLRPIRFNQGRGYYFIYDMTGLNILIPFSPHLEGRNLWDLQDSKGMYTIRRFIRAIRKDGEGFLRWYWYKPGTVAHMSEKIGYARSFPPFDWWIGTGEYVADVERDIQAEVLAWINKIRFGENGYIFVYNFDAITLAHYDPKNLGINRWDATDPNGVKVLQELIRLSKRPEGGFFRYVATINPSTGRPAEKISYARSIPEWEWTIGAGVYVTDIERVIAEREAALNRKIRGHMIRIGVALVSLMVMILLIARLLSRMTVISIEAFTRFFDQSAAELVPIDPKVIHFTELQGLARAANRMVVERNRAIETLRSSEERLSLALDSTGQGFWDWDVPTGQVIWDDRIVHIIGFKPTDLSPRIDSWASLAHPDEAPAVQARMAAHLRGETEAYRAEYRIRTKSGQWKWILDGGRVIQRDENGLPLRAVGTYLDVTARKQAELDAAALHEELSRSRKMEALGLLAGGVAHDLNNVLSGIVGYPELLILDLPADSPLRRPLSAIQESGQKAAAIVQDLLTLARRGVTVRKVINLNDVIADYLRSPEYEKLIEHHPGIRVESDLAPELFNILGSPVHLRTTVMNLVSNAAEAQPDGGRIRIVTENRGADQPDGPSPGRDEGAYVRLEIRDEGTGIGAEDLKRIFEPFYTKKVMGRSGTGLGMAVVWGTVSDHDGRISVGSDEGVGTTIEILLPATDQTEAGEAGVPPMADYTGDGETILVVDDVAEQREIAALMLRRLGYTVEAVDSGEAAVEHLRCRPADLVILDMIMDPGIDGLETFRRIRQVNPGQRAIIASGYAETDRVKEALRLGASVYVKKPYTLEKLGTAVKAGLEGGPNPPSPPS